MITKQTPLKEVLKLGKECDKCNHCCKFGTGFMLNKELSKIAKFLKTTEEKLKKDCLEEVEKFNTKLQRPRTVKKKGKPYGVCIFLNGKGCRIHEVKPVNCRIGNCKEQGEELSIWFMLNYFVDENDPESIRQYKVYLESGGKTLPGGKLEEIVPNKEILKKMLTYEVLK